MTISCGCGTTTLLLALKTGADGAAAGIDISAPMLNVARARAMAQNAGIVFREADASAYEFQPVFDLVFSRTRGALHDQVHEHPDQRDDEDHRRQDVHLRRHALARRPVDEQRERDGLPRVEVRDDEVVDREGER